MKIITSKKTVGIVETQYFKMQENLKLESGQELETPTIAYETYGQLNQDKTNVIFVCHALTGDAHAAGFHEGDEKPGWWDIIIGPKKPLDTNKFFIICSNVIGSCKGSTGPSSINPKTGKEYGMDFPIITIHDMVNAQKKLLDSLGISQLYAVIGGSMGGMQVLQWTLDYSHMIKKSIMIATGAYSTPQQIGFNVVERGAIFEDPNWQNGNYYESDKTPEIGLSVARMIGHITYLSNESMHKKFGRRLQDKNKEDFNYDFDDVFEVESYLHHQGSTFTKIFDANSYIYITKALDYFDVRINNSLEEAFKNIKCKMLLLSVSSDWLYTPTHMEEVVEALQANNVDVEYVRLNSGYGHDAFLIENGQMNYILNNFISNATVSDLMSDNVVTLNDSSDIKEAAKLMLSTKKTHISIVDDDEKLIGIITAWDLSKSIAEGTNNIDDIMTKDVITCHENDSIDDIKKLMNENRISSIPVVDDENHIIGNITSFHINYNENR